MVIRHKRVTFDVKLISFSLGISEREAISIFKDGRVAGRFAEIWCASLYSLEDADYNNPMFDSLRRDVLGDMSISVKTIGKSGIRFQRSRNIGSGRSCTTDDLLEAVGGIDFYIIVDVQDFPEVSFIPVKSKTLLDKVKDGSLTPSGWSRERVYSELLTEENGWEEMSFPRMSYGD